MKKIKGIVVILSILIISLTLPGCGGKNDGGSGDLSDYFPIDTGKEWTYKITIGEAEPLSYREIVWDLKGGGTLIQSAMRRFLPLLEENSPDKFLLKIAVKRPAAPQELLNYPIGVELTIEEDELGIFAEYEKVFWAMTSSGRFMAEQMVTYSPLKPWAPSNALGSHGRKNAYSNRLLLFEAEPGAKLSGMGSITLVDMIYYEGIDNNLPGYEGNGCLHFKRVVVLKKGNWDREPEPPLNKDFTEDTWFAKGIGLVRLEQKVEGVPSMTWTLEIDNGTMAYNSTM